MKGRRARVAPIDPSTVRLSDHFLLSDFMGCHSVFAKGLPNVFDDPDGSKLAEGKHLCETLLEPLLDEHGPLSISYGYISPALSRQIVKYQDPDMPSYHRWDKGAAADVCVHAWVKDKPPIKLAHAIDEQYAYSRMITYSESPYICLATQLNEGDKPRRAFYENRFTGKEGAKPTYIRKPTSDAARRKAGQEIPLSLDWRGAGYPTYHGGGIRQYQHTRLSRYSVLSDFLYSTKGVCEGVANVPSHKQGLRVFKDAGKFYDRLLEELDVPRVSIVRAYESFRLADYPLFSWKDYFAIDFIPPSYINVNDAAQAAYRTGMVSAYGAASDGRRVVRVLGLGACNE